jgi:hypothetical protein
MKCPYCGREYSDSFIKRHIRYHCKKNPQRDICIIRKNILEKIEEKKGEKESDVRHEEYYNGWIDALSWVNETF